MSLTLTFGIFYTKLDFEYFNTFSIQYAKRQILIF
jgi:hypothetical protein